MLLLLNGVPIDYPRLPGPGEVAGERLADVVLGRRAERYIIYQSLVDELRSRLGVPTPRYRERTCSVVVCTHRRPGYVTDVLGALCALDPRADEIIIVDNDPGERDCKAEVERAGAVYVREDRRGLDNARNAGLGRARGELVAFTDDDCVPSQQWLKALPELFDDPLVGAVTGPGFAYRLDNPSQVRFEDSGGFRRGLQRRVWDWRSLSPPQAARAGAGANMIFRREVLAAVGVCFPPELDAGTATQSGGDLYALYKVLRAGYRIVYDPSTYVLHQHRPDMESLHRTFWGYGVGLSATLTKLLVEERELATPAAWWWLASQWARALHGWAAGTEDALGVNLAWDYLRGGFAGPLRWRRALREAGPTRELSLPAAHPVSEDRGARAILTAPGRADGDGVVVSIIVPTVGRRHALSRCLEALARQAPGTPLFEVVVVMDAPPPADRLPPPPPSLTVRYLETGGQGAAAARNAGAGEAVGRILLFLDDDLVPTPQLVAAHLQRHNDDCDGSIVVGYSPPRPPCRSLASMAASLWWEDHFRATRHSSALTFTHVLSGNVSVSKAAFRRVGGFDESFGRFRREDWEWGIRALREGLRLVYAEEAVASHEFRIDARGLIEGARREGHGDALLLTRFPFAGPSLPAGRPGIRESTGHPLRRTALAALGHPGTKAILCGLLQSLESARARKAWIALLGHARRGAYLRGLKEGRAGGKLPRGQGPVLAVELTNDAPIPAPRVAVPEIQLQVKGHVAGRLRPASGNWNEALAHQLAGALHADMWAKLPSARRDGGVGGRGGVSGAAVVSGPGRLRGDLEGVDELRDAGVEVAVEDGPAAEHWVAIDASIKASGACVVAVPLPGIRLKAACLDDALSAFEASRLGALALYGFVGWPQPSAISLWSRTLSPRPLSVSLIGAHCLLVRTSAYRSVGGFASWAARLGPQGPAVDLLERLLEAGYVVGSCATPELEIEPESPGARAAEGWRSTRVRAGLAAARARGMGVAGAPYLVRHAVMPSLRALYRFARRPERDLSALRYPIEAAAGLLIGFREARPGHDQLTPSGLG